MSVENVSPVTVDAEYRGTIPKVVLLTEVTGSNEVAVAISVFPWPRDGALKYSVLSIHTPGT